MASARHLFLPRGVEALRQQVIDGHVRFSRLRTTSPFAPRSTRREPAADSVIWGPGNVVTIADVMLMMRPNSSLDHSRQHSAGQ